MIDRSRLRQFVKKELSEAARLERTGNPAHAFAHLERAHILSQYDTSDHVGVHMAMLHWGWRRGDFREVLGQVTRIVGAATKTAFGWVPTGNTGGADVSPFRTMNLPDDLAAIIASARR